MKVPKKWPKVVEIEHSIVKIYRTPSMAPTNLRPSIYLGEKRVRKTYSGYAMAFKDAETTAAKFSQDELNVLDLTGEARLAYVCAVKPLKPTGIPLEMAANALCGHIPRARQPGPFRPALARYDCPARLVGY